MIGLLVKKFAPDVLAWAATIAVGVAVAEAGVILVQELRIANLKAAPVREALAAERKARRTEQQQAATTSSVERAAEEARVEYRDRYRTITEKVYVYVTPESDRSCPVPVGFVRLHDAAARAEVLPEVSDPSGQPNDAPSGVALSTVASTVVGNYAGCTDDRAKLVGLQAWVAQQAALQPN